jgi:hypothetical protein
MLALLANEDAVVGEFLVGAAALFVFGAAAQVDRFWDPKYAAVIRRVGIAFIVIAGICVIAALLTLVS